LILTSQYKDLNNRATLAVSEGQINILNPAYQLITMIALYGRLTISNLLLLC
jgi:hypothetical protein